jgi:hypothetical protein
LAWLSGVCAEVEIQEEYADFVQRNQLKKAQSLKSNFDFDLDGPLIFLRGVKNVGVDQIQRDRNSVTPTIARSSFGEWFYTNPRSPERALCNPKGWFNANTSLPFTTLDLQHLKQSAMMVARPEIIAESLIASGGDELAFVDFVLGSRMARDHVFAIASNLENEERLDLARCLISTAETRLAAEAALKELDH